MNTKSTFFSEKTFRRYLKKGKQIPLICFFFITCNISNIIYAQTGTSINYNDNIGPITANYNGLVNGKHSYTGSFGLNIKWSGTRWEINFGTAQPIYYNLSDTSNPPSLADGGWIQIPPGATTINQLNGSGTVSVSCDIDLTSISSVTNESCSGTADGSFTVNATCTSCTAIEYSNDNGATWVGSGNSHTFSGLTSATYNIKVRDTGDNSCEDTGSQAITVDDSTNPVPSCNNITVTLDNTGNYTLTAANLAALGAGSTDNCSAFANLDITSSQSAFTCSDLGNNNVTITVKDEANNTATCSAVITVEFDSGTFSFSSGNNFTEGNSGTFNHSVTLMRQNVGCIDNVTVLNYGSGANYATPGVDFVALNTVVNMGATEASKTFTVTINGDSDFEADEVFLLDATGIYSGSVQPGSVYILNDDCQVVINSIDNVSNESCPGADDGAFEVNASCSTCTNVLEYSNDGGSTWQNGATFSSLADATYNISVREQIGGATTCTATTTQAITVNDSTNPVPSCNDITVTLDNTGNYSLTAANLAALGAGSTDNCSAFANLDITSSQSAFTCSDLGNNNVTITVKDEANNMATCSAVITVEFDSGTFSFSSGNNFTEGNSGTSNHSVTLMRQNVGCIDNVTVLNYGSGANYATPGVDFVALNTVVNMGATEASKTFTVTINGDSDFEADEVFLLDATGIYSGSVQPGSVNILNDDCQVVINSIDNVSNESCPGTDDGAFEVNASCSTCTNVLEYSNDGGSTWQNSATFSSLADATYNISVREQIGGATTCTATTTQTINAGVDSTDPVPSCTGITVTLDNTGNYALTASDLNTISAGSTDNCTAFADLSFNLAQTNFSCNDLGTNNVIVTVLDASSNDASCTAVVTVQPPASVFSIADQSQDEGQSGTNTMSFTVTRTNATCATIINYATTDGTAMAGSDYVTAAGTLSFAATELTKTIDVTINGDTTFEGDETFTVMLSSPSANTTISDATAIGNIQDDDCSIVINSIAVMHEVCPGAGDGQITIDATQTGGSSMEYSINGGTSFQSNNVFGNLHDNAYNIVVRDVNDNACMDTDASTINAGIDTTAPTITCPANATIQCSDDSSPSSTGTATATDNCTPNNQVVITFNDSSSQTASGASNANYTITRTWTATDALGNQSNCIQTIMVIDSQMPIVTCPANITIQCTDDSSPANTGNATATDNCTPNNQVVITFNDLSTQTASGASNANYTITRTWSGTDLTGNVGNCTQIISVIDNTSPSPVCQDATVVLDNSGNGILTTAMVDNGSSDNCSPVTLSLSQTAFDCSHIGTQTVTLTVTDDTGNMATCNATITIDPSQMPTTIYVDSSATGANDGSSWTDAFTEMTNALELAANCPLITTVNIAEGEYTPSQNGDKTKYFTLGEGCSLFGGFPAGGGPNADPFSNPTILSGDLNNDDVDNANGCDGNIGDNSYTVAVIPVNVTNATTIRGLTITGGHGDGSILDPIAQRAGGGLDIYGTPIIEYLTITNNCAEMGGGVYVNGLNNSISPEFRNVRFIDNNTINAGGAVYNDGRGSGENTAKYYCCEFQDNSTSTSGGAVYNDGSSGGDCSPEFINCTFSGNKATNSGAAMNNYFATPMIANTCMFDNSALMPISDFNSTVMISNSIVEGNYQGMMYIDPQFVVCPSCAPTAPATWNLNLQATSPALNIADSSILPAYISEDVMGNPRNSGGGIDIGAYERQAALPVELINFSARAKGEQVALLTWQTAIESNNKGFEVQHSTDGATWDALDFVQGNGNSTILIDYQYEDKRASIGVNYYRLAQMDYDGTISYSTIESVRFNTGAITLYPNPTQNEINLDFATIQDGSAAIRILDFTGKELYNGAIDIDNQQAVLQLNDFNIYTTGVYFIEIQFANKSATSLKFVKID